MANTDPNVRTPRESAAEGTDRKIRVSSEDAQLGSEEEQRSRARQRISEVENNFLAEVPKIPGYHSMWASTTSTTNTIRHYARRGYTPILMTDIPADKREDYKSTEGQQKAEYAGMVMCNEMLAMKIPFFEYQENMKHSHHDLPMDHERSMQAAREKIEAIAPGNVKTGEGFEQGLGGINKGKRPPVFE